MLKNFSEILYTKGGEPIFQVWGGGKKGGDQNISKVLGGEPKPYTLWPFQSNQQSQLQIERCDKDCGIVYENSWEYKEYGYIGEKM